MLKYIIIIIVSKLLCSCGCLYKNEFKQQYENVSERQVLQSKIIRYQKKSTDTIILNYSRGVNTDTVFYGKDTYFISKKSTQFIITNQQNDTLYSFYVKLQSDTVLYVAKLIYNDNRRCKEIRSFYSFNTSLKDFFNEIDFLFLTNLPNYNFCVNGEQCEVNNFPSDEYFNFLSNKLYAQKFFYLKAEVDSIFVDGALVDYQLYSLKKGFVTGGFGFYCNSFNEIRNEVIPFLVIKRRQCKQTLKIKGENILLNEVFYEFYRKDKLKKRTSNYTFQNFDYKEVVKYKYPTDDIFIYTTYINSIKNTKVIQHVNFKY